MSFASVSASSSESTAWTAVNGANSSSLEERWSAREAPDDRRLDVEAALERAVGEVLAAGVDRAVAAGLGDRLLVPVDGLLVDDRAEPVLALDRVADRDLLGLLDQHPDELVVDGLLDVDPRVGRALLAAEPEGAAHDPLGRLLEVGLAADDRRVLAAHLDDASGGARCSRTSWYSCIPTSYEPVKTMPSIPGFDWSSSPTVSPGPITKLTTPGGNARVLERVDEVHAGQRRRRRGLVDHGVAGEERARRPGPPARAIGKLNGLMTAKTPCGRRIERVWTAASPEVVERVVVEVVVLGGLGVVADQVRGLLDLAERLEPVLADLEGHVRAVAHLALRDELGSAAEDREPLLPRRVPPARRGSTRGLDRALRVLSVALRERPDEDVPVDGRAGLEGPRRAVDPAAVDEVPMVGAEPGAGLLDALLVQRVELLVVVAERRVGDLDPRLGLRWSSGLQDPGRARAARAARRPISQSSGQSTAELAGWTNQATGVGGREPPC